MKPAGSILSKTNLLFGLSLLVMAALSALFIVACSSPGGGGSAPTVETPVIAPPAGSIEQDTAQIAITCATSGAVIHFTTDDTAPSTSSPTYSAPIEVKGFSEGPLHVKAYAVKTGNTDSAVASADFSVVDNIGPAPVITAGVSGGTNAPFDVTVTYNEPVAGFDQTDLSLSNASVGGILDSNPVFTFTINPTAVGNVTIGIAAGVCTDTSANTNANTAASPFSIYYDPNAPQPIISSSSSDPTNANPIPVTITFDRDVTGFTKSDLILGNGSASHFAGGPAVYTVDITPAGQGPVTVDIDAGICTSLTGSPNLTAAQFFIIYDSVSPTVIINQATAQNDPANGTIDFTVVFSQPSPDFSTGDVTLSGTAGATNAVVTGSGSTYNVAVSGMTGDGTVIVNIAAGVAHDAAGNANTASTSTDNTVTYDATPPTVTIDQAAGQVDPTNASPVNFTVVFSESVSDFTTGDVTLTGTAGATTGTVSGSGTTYNVAVSDMTGSGTVIANIASGAAHDAAGNGNAASVSADNSVDFDNSGLNVTVEQAGGQTDPANAGPINFTVVFSKPVADFATGDVTLSGTAGAATATVSGSGTTYNVAVSGMTGSGTVRASIDAGAAHDAASNANFASSSSDNEVTYDVTAPGLTLSSLAPNPTNSGFTVTFTFTEAISGFTTGDIDFTAGSGSASVPSTSDNVTWTSIISPSTQGTVTVTVNAAAVQDQAGNGNTAATNSVTRTYDTNAPTVTVEQAGGQADPTNGSPIDFTVVFSESVSDFTTGDVTLTGTAGATTAVVTGSGTTYNVAVSGMSGAGTVIASIASGMAHDAAGNGNAASTSSDNTVSFDNTGLNVSIDQAGGQADPANAGPINFTVVFSKPVADFATGDVSLSGSAGATTASVTGSGTTYNVAVTGMTGSGTVIASIAAGVAQDGASNPNTASTSGDDTVTYDMTPPGLTLSSSAPNPTNTGYTVTFTFTEAVSGFTAGDIAFTAGTGSASVPSTSDNVTWTSIISPSSQGTVTVTVNAGAVQDQAGNNNTAATNSITRTYDSTAPTVTVNQAGGQADPTNGSPVNFTVVFSESVSDFATGDVSLSGTAGATTATVTGSGTTYNVAVSGMTGSGTVIASIVSSMAHDAAGNGNAASTSTDNTVTYDVTAPTVTINQAGGQADPTAVSPINFTVVFSESVSDFATGDVTITGTAGGTKTGTVTGSGTTYNVAVTGMTTNGTVVASVAAGAAHDAVGNAGVASTSTDNTVTWSVTYTVTYSGNGNTGGNPPVDGNAYATGNLVTVLANTDGLVKAGYSFVGWCVNADGSGTSYTPGNTFAMGSANVLLYAKWTALPTYTVTYLGNGNTGGNPPVDGTSYVQGSTVTVLGNTGGMTKTGYSFVGWDDIPNTGFYYPGNQFSIDDNITLTAKWSANPTYTVTYYGNGSTSGNPPTDNTTYENGALVTVLGNTGNLQNPGYSFTGWNTQANGSGTPYNAGNTFNMGSANVGLYAQWSALPTYTVAYNGNGSTGGNVPVDGANYLTGADVTVLGNTGALVRTGYAFNGWNTQADGLGTSRDPGQTFAMGSSNVTLYAKWAQDSASSWDDLHSASLPYAAYDAVATSDDGTYVVAVIRDGSGAASGIYTSSNSGTSWTRTHTTARTFRCVAMSGTGQYALAGVSTGALYRSTNNGASWAVPTGAGNRAWRGVAISSDGSIMYAAVNGGQIYKSTNNGANWAALAGSTSQAYYGISCSDDGTIVAAIVNNGGIYVSTNSGTNWTQKLVLASAWRGVSVSGNGQVISGAIQAGTYPNSGIWVSVDPSKTFTSWTQTDTNSVSYRCLATSVDGTRMGVGIKGTTGGYVSISNNYGANWYQRTYTGMLVWTGVATTSTGSKFYFTNASGGSGGSVWVYLDQ